MPTIALSVLLAAALALGSVAQAQGGGNTLKTEDVAAVRALMYRHFSVLNELDPEKRKRLSIEVYDPHVTLIDPLVLVDGRAELEKLYEGIHQRAPGLVFRVVGDIDVHHDVARIHWGLAKPGASDTQTGDDIVRIKEGKIVDIIVFFDGQTQRSRAGK